MIHNLAFSKLRSGFLRSRFLLCAALFFSLSTTARGQITQVGYNFQQAPNIATDATQACSLSLTMNCLAANGDGQWTAFNPGGIGQWSLLANHLEDPSSNCAYHGGIVQYGNFAMTLVNPDEAKATANLNGGVRYVWPDPSDRKHFIVQGFDEVLGQVDLKFRSNGAGMTLSDPASVLPIKQPIAVISGAVSTNQGGLDHPVVNSPYETSRDEFDIACDTRWLYIAWEEHTLTSNNIFVTAISMSDASVAPGFPKLIGTGRRPTIAVDVRNANANPDFDVAWVSDPTSGSGTILWRSCQSGALQGTKTLTAFMQEPGYPHITYNYAYHVRVMVGSVNGANPSPNGPRSIYAMVGQPNTPAGQAHLVFFKDVQRYADVTWSPDDAIYVDGTWSPISHPVPVDGVFPVVNDPIISFSNPYDGEGILPLGTPGLTPYNEYHCLYRLVRSYTDQSNNSVTHYPLMIVRGKDASVALTTNQCLNTPCAAFTINRPDPVHSFSEDPDTYIGAVNQMGIHVHWRMNTRHYYTRDTRSLDEPIEENTLASYTNIVRDGTDHQSPALNVVNQPTSILKKSLVLWAEPSANAFANYPGGPQESILNFTGPNAKLLIQSQNGDYYPCLVGFPTFLVNFSDPTQALTIGHLGTFDYYGNAITGHLKHFVFSGLGSSLPTLALTGGMPQMSGANGYPTVMQDVASLIVHGSCAFTTTEDINFTATGAKIQFAREVGCASALVYDAYDYCYGSQSILNSVIYGGRAIDASNDLQLVQVKQSNLTAGSSQFSLTNSLVQNLGSSGGWTCPIFTECQLGVVIVDCVVA